MSFKAHYWPYCTEYQDSMNRRKPLHILYVIIINIGHVLTTQRLNIYMYMMDTSY